MLALRIDRDEFVAFAPRDGHRRGDVLVIIEELP
jgi:hypothetical protein